MSPRRRDLAHRFHSVVSEIKNDLLNLNWVATHRRQVVGQLKGKLGLLFVSLEPKQIRDAVDDCAYLNEFSLLLLWLNEGPKAGHDLAGAACFLGDTSDVAQDL